MTNELIKEIEDQIKLLQSQRDQLDNDIDDAFARLEDLMVNT